MSNQGTYNHLGDHTQWSSSRMTGLGLSIAGGVAAAFTGILVNLAGQRGRRFISARVLRQYHQAAARVVRLERDFLEARLNLRASKSLNCSATLSGSGPVPYVVEHRLALAVSDHPQVAGAQAGQPRLLRP